jgi:hypothetical protein
MYYNLICTPMWTKFYSCKKWVLHMVNQQRGHQKGPTPRMGRTKYATVEEIPMGEEVLAGKFFLNEHPIIILFDSGASYDFISSTCAKKARLSMVVMEAPYVISTPGG